MFGFKIKFTHNTISICELLQKYEERYSRLSQSI